MDKLLNMLRYKSEGSDIDFKSTQYRFNNGSEGNDSNLLIVFYVQIMPDDFVAAPPILRTTATSVPAVPGAASDSGYAAQFAAYIAC